MCVYIKGHLKKNVVERDNSQLDNSNSPTGTGNAKEAEGEKESQGIVEGGDGIKDGR